MQTCICPKIQPQQKSQLLSGSWIRNRFIFLILTELRGHNRKKKGGGRTTVFFCSNHTICLGDYWLLWHSGDPEPLMTLLQSAADRYEAGVLS